MKAVLALMLILSSPSAHAASSDLSNFLKTCAWGIGIGAAIGAVSLAFESRPSEHTVNVARGASLGLYGGIVYGVMQINPPPHRMPEEFSGWISPKIETGRVDGLNAHLVLANF